MVKLQFRIAEDISEEFQDYIILHTSTVQCILQKSHEQLNGEIFPFSINNGCVGHGSFSPSPYKRVRLSNSLIHRSCLTFPKF